MNRGSHTSFVLPIQVIYTPPFCATFPVMRLLFYISCNDLSTYVIILPIYIVLCVSYWKRNFPIGPYVLRFVGLSLFGWVVVGSDCCSFIRAEKLPSHALIGALLPCVTLFWGIYRVFIKYCVFP